LVGHTKIQGKGQGFGGRGVTIVREGRLKKNGYEVSQKKKPVARKKQSDLRVGGLPRGEDDYMGPQREPWALKLWIQSIKSN